MNDDDDLMNEDENTDLTGDPLTDQGGTLSDDEEQVESALDDDEDDTELDDEDEETI